MDILEIPDSMCSCSSCQTMCDRPCWPTPTEASELMDRGYGPKLMLDYWIEGDYSYTELICPANTGHEGKDAPNWPGSSSKCTLLKDGLCSLHDLGLKPIEGRKALCHSLSKKEDKGYNLHEQVKNLWMTPEGKEVVQRFKDEFLNQS